MILIIEKLYFHGNLGNSLANDPAKSRIIHENKMADIVAVNTFTRIENREKFKKSKRIHENKMADIAAVNSSLREDYKAGKVVCSGS